MKIIVMDSANVRIEVLNVPDHMIEEDIEQFLAEHDYSLNNISWMAAPIDFVPVQFHEYGICHSDILMEKSCTLSVKVNSKTFPSMTVCRR